MPSNRTPPRRALSHSAPVLLALAAAALSVGCAADRNARLEIGAHERLPILHADRELIAVGDEPSLLHNAATRAHWNERRVVAHVDGVSHQPIYRYTYERRLETEKSAARVSGAYPTPETALEDESDVDSLFWQAVLGPFAGGLEIAAFPFRALANPPWSETQSPPYPEDRHDTSATEPLGE